MNNINFKQTYELDLRDIETLWINLDRDLERRQRMESMFVALEMDNNKRIPGYPATTVLEGCGKAQENTLKSIDNLPTLVLEDDCVHHIDNFKPIINVPNDADAIYLGCSHWGMDFNSGRNGPIAQWEIWDNEWLRVTNMLATHAILYLNEDFKKACQDIIHKYVYEIHDHIDVGYCSILQHFKVYTPRNPFFYQSSSPDVTMTGLETAPKMKVRPSPVNNSFVRNHVEVKRTPEDGFRIRAIGNDVSAVRKAPTKGKAIHSNPAKVNTSNRVRRKGR